MKLKIYFLLSFIFIFVGCTENLFEAAADKDTDAALYYDAKLALDESDYDAAIAKIEDLSSTYRAREDVKLTYAGALAGQCGMSFFSLFNGIAELDFTSGAFFILVMNIFNGETTQKESCKSSDLVVREVMTAGPTKLSNVRLFMVLLSLAKMSAILHEGADTKNAAGDVVAGGDGLVDTGFSACNSTTLTDNDINHTMTGFNAFTQNIDALSNTGTGLSDTLTAITGFCEFTVPNSAPYKPALRGQTFNPCEITDVSLATDVDRWLFREVLSMTGVGLSNCAVIGTCCPALRDSVLL